MRLPKNRRVDPRPHGNPRLAHRRAWGLSLIDALAQTKDNASHVVPRAARGDLCSIPHPRAGSGASLSRTNGLWPPNLPTSGVIVLHIIHNDRATTPVGLRPDDKLVAVARHDDPDCVQE